MRENQERRARMSVIFLSELMSEIGQRGRNFLQRNRETPRDPAELCEALVSRRGEVSCFVLSEAILESWEGLDREGQVGFLLMLAERFGPNRQAVLDAMAAVAEEGDAAALY